MSAIKLASDSLIVTPAGGNIEYNGQFFATDSNNERAQLGRLVVETAKASTSGTSIDFTGIPAWAKRITVMFNGVSTNGTSIIQVQIGDSGGIENTSYAGAGNSGAATAAATSGFVISGNSTAARLHVGAMTIVNITGNTWISSIVSTVTDNNLVSFGAGIKTLSATLDRVRITTVNGTDTFDAGSINILYEG